MLNPKDLTDALVAVLKTNCDLTDLVGVNNISAFHYNLGSERTLAERIATMSSPSVVVHWEQTQGGNFSGQQIYKHRFQIVIRAQSMTHISYEQLWHAMCNGAVNGTALNMRCLSILPDLDLMDTPSVTHMTDGEGSDFFVGQIVLPEIGDVPSVQPLSFDYYVNPYVGSDKLDGTTRQTAWLSTTMADQVILTEGQTIAYFLYGQWYLYRTPGMIISDSGLPIDIITASADEF